MNIKPTKIEFIDGLEGVYSISPNISDKKTLKTWIAKKKFISYIDDKYRMIRHTRKRNKLYSFEHPIYKKEVILKVSTIDKQYNLSRRINLLLSNFFNDYNYRAFEGSILLRKIDVSCANPIAYWTISDTIFKKTSFYMYEKIPAKHSLFSFSQELLAADNKISKEIFHQLAINTTNIVRHIHEAGFRQGDPHPGNFLISTTKNQDISKLSINEISNMNLFIIDLDKFCRSKPLGRTIKRFFDLRCMRRCTLGPYNQQDMLRFYLRDEYSVVWEHVLKFWIRGGFNPFKWFRTPKRGQ